MILPRSNSVVPLPLYPAMLAGQMKRLLTPRLLTDLRPKGHGTNGLIGPFRLFFRCCVPNCLFLSDQKALPCSLQRLTHNF